MLCYNMLILSVVLSVQVVRMIQMLCQHLQAIKPDVLNCIIEVVRFVT